MFKSDDNFAFFLKQYDHYLSPVIDTYAFCLLQNHFHFFIRIKDEDELILFQRPADNTVEKSFHEIVSHQFRKLFQSYSMAFNKQQGRIGTLFQTPFKRTLIISDGYFTQLIYYIHSNPQHHNLMNDFRDWKWSSYSRLLLDRPTKLLKTEVMDWFGGKDAYKMYHQMFQEFMLDKGFLLDE